jgi:LCP family protein required for cell wall assembly
MIKRAVLFTILLGIVCVSVPLVGSPRRGSAAALLAGRVHASFNPNRGKIFVLVIGNDAREGNPDASRADAMHVVGVNTKTMKGGILNFPRDSYVAVPGFGSMKMNESLYVGGPELLARTIEVETGIRLDYWIMTGFQGFRDIVRKLGGVKMHIPVDMFDPGGSGANLKKGTRVLDPEQALAFNRTRKVLANGDIDRSTNQGRFLRALLRMLREQLASNPAALFRWMSIAQQETRLNVPPEELFRLGVVASQVMTKDVPNVTVPVSIGSVGAASVVFISPNAVSIYKKFGQTGTL